MIKVGSAITRRWGLVDWLGGGGAHAFGRKGGEEAQVRDAAHIN